MFYYIMHIFMFKVLTLIYFSSYTSAYWLHEPFGVVPPPTSEMRSCLGWINFYNFGEDVNKHVSLAQNRDRRYDNNVDVHALIYAHILVAFPGVRQDLSEYCSHYFRHDDLSRLTSIISFKRSCDVWIYHYGYKFENDEYNRERAINRERNEDDNISVFAVGYARFIETSKQKSNTISLEDYCIGMGLSARLWPFVSFKGTKKTCKEWINLSEYGDEVDYNNLNKAIKQDKKFMASINVFTKRYIENLLSYTSRRNLFCSSSSCVRDVPLTPAEFCNTVGGYGDVPRTYYDNE